MNINKRENSINLIRIIAALQVFTGHAIVHLKVTSFPRAISWFLPLFQGVPIFFILSGFLIWDSINRTHDFKSFVKKRVLRLYPELWGGILLNFFLILLLYYKNLNWPDFIIFQITQSTVFQFFTPSSLRAYGCGTPNCSLWTICVMVQCYIMLYAVFFFLHKKSKTRWCFALILGILANTILPPIIKQIVPELVNKLFLQTFVPYFWLFLLGAFISEYFDNIIVFLKKYWLAALVLEYIVIKSGFDAGVSGTIKSILLSVSIIGFAYRFPKITIKHDITYGFYIYHMIVINVLIEIGFVGNMYSFLVSLIVTILLAYLSYFGIGKFSSKLKSRL